MLGRAMRAVSHSLRTYVVTPNRRRHCRRCALLMDDLVRERDCALGARAEIAAARRRLRSLALGRLLTISALLPPMSPSCGVQAFWRRRPSGVADLGWTSSPSDRATRCAGSSKIGCPRPSSPRPAASPRMRSGSWWKPDWSSRYERRQSKSSSTARCSSAPTPLSAFFERLRGPCSFPAQRRGH